MSTDTVAYTRDLYGPGGPKYDAAFVEEDDERREREEDEELGSEEDSDSGAD